VRALAALVLGLATRGPGGHTGVCRSCRAGRTARNQYFGNFRDGGLVSPIQQSVAPTPEADGQTVQRRRRPLPTGRTNWSDSPR